MNKVDALNEIKNAWQNSDISLGEKIIIISSAFYSSGLDLASTASHINATPSELDALLKLAEFEDDVIKMISEVNPPKSSWEMLANSNDDEIHYALVNFKKKSDNPERTYTSMSEYTYSLIVELSGPSMEQKVNEVSRDSINLLRKKAEDHQAIPEKEIKFLKSIAAQKRQGKTLSDKQISWLISIFEKCAEKNVITHDSIDNDQDMCDEILKAIGR